MAKRQDSNAIDTDDAEGFLRRWSRRKHAARTEEDVPQPSEVESTAHTAMAAAQESVPAPVTDADLPPVELLHEDSDYSGFLSPQVSEALRRQALRKLFASSKFQLRDGLDDYDEDYRNFETLRDTVTAHLRHRMEVEAERLAQATEPDRGGEADDVSPSDLANNEDRVARTQQETVFHGEHDGSEQS